MKLSIVTTLYKSSPYIYEFYERISKEAKKITQDYEIIFVDDGSPDDSLQKAIVLHEKDKKVKVIELSRNFGHHKAIMTGLSYAKGDYVFLIDSDLEEEPELLGIFWEEMQNNKDIDVIYGVQEKRKGGWFERWSGEVFYWLMNMLFRISIPKNILTARLMKREYVRSLMLYKEQNVFLAGIWAHTGFKQKGFKVKKFSKSESTYNFRKKIILFINAVTYFTNKPLIYIFYIGFIITFTSALFMLNLIYKKIFFDFQILGWTSIIVSIWFFGGLISLFLGIIGIYLARLFDEVKQRPYTIIRKIYDINQKIDQEIM